MNTVIIVAHGSPSDPEPKQAALKALAAKVQSFCPDIPVKAATLAKQGALESALEDCENPVIYPFFMAEGWFTKREIPRRLEKMGRSAAHMDPFGIDPALEALILQDSLQAAKDAGLEPAETDLILCAHGSKIARRSKDSAYAMAQKLQAAGSFWRVRVGLIEEAPFIETVARTSRQGLCLPFFALRAGHVEGDIPHALRLAGFTGPLLAPIGEHAAIPALIARAITRYIAN
ncbi:CbiX/SirB N-terminal domain-containing protein [Thioclava sp. GXIMD4216]|uniref:CbiX/SirB N-terminal domain-containing protein n=1 Tax=Thioclava sp. GXIMD4216 TaxID=3131929 RepID=UPI0030CC315D